MYARYATYYLTLAAEIKKLIKKILCGKSYVKIKYNNEITN